MVAKTNSISVEEAHRGIFIDFEGFKDHSPSIIGVLCDGKFEQLVLDPKLASAAEAKGIEQASLANVIDSLVAECMAKQRSIIAFSTHELNVIKEYCDIDVSDHYKNALKFAKRWRSKVHPDLLLESNSLDQFLCLPVVDYNVPRHLGKGNATKRLKAVLSMLDTRGDFVSISPVKKAQWTKLLDYNKHDVLGLQALVNVAAAEMAGPAVR